MFESSQEILGRFLFWKKNLDILTFLHHFKKNLHVNFNHIFFFFQNTQDIQVHF